MRIRKNGRNFKGRTLLQTIEVSYESVFHKLKQTEKNVYTLLQKQKEQLKDMEEGLYDFSQLNFSPVRSMDSPQDGIGDVFLISGTDNYTCENIRQYSKFPIIADVNPQLCDTLYVGMYKIIYLVHPAWRFE